MVSEAPSFSSLILVALRARPPNLPDFQPQGCVSPEIDEPYISRSGSSTAAMQLVAAKIMREMRAVLINI